jgi:hypothetical protein
MKTITIEVPDNLGVAVAESEEDLPRALRRWSGTIPPQKWTTFYMKVVSPFATAAGLSLRVDIEVPAEKDDPQAKAQVEKIRGALRDLNPDDDVDLS